MDPTITAAWITGGVGALGIAGTVATAIVGSRNTRKATERTVAAGTASTMATLVAAREDRLWDKRCAAYEEALTGLLLRQVKRQSDAQEQPQDEVSEQMLEGFYERDELPGMGRLIAYASDAVTNAFNAAQRAHGTVRAHHARRAAVLEAVRLTQAVGDLNAMPNRQKVADVQRELAEALKAADSADVALFAAIRDELRSKPEAATLPAAVPPQRRKRWHHH